MSTLIIAATLVVLTIVGFYFGRSRAVATVSGQTRNLNSLPGYYGYYVAIWCGIPAFLVFGLWLALEPLIAEMLLVSSLPDTMRELPPERLGLMLNDIRNLATGNIVSRDVDPVLQAAADRYNSIRTTGLFALAVAVVAMAIAGITYGRHLIVPQSARPQ